MKSSVVRPLLGLATVLVIATIVFTAVLLFRGDIGTTVPLTVMSERAGLVMAPNAKVKLLGVPVGRVESIEDRPNGLAAIHLEMDGSQLSQIPDNVRVDIASPTVFGAKSVELIPPADPSSVTLSPGGVLDASNVTVELNTIFEQLTSVLAKVQPEKLNETLGAIASALDGRGEEFGQALSDLDKLLIKIEPSLPSLSHDLEVAPTVLNAYADAAPDLMRILENANKISQTVVDKQNDLDAFLLSATGLADIGNDVIGSNTEGLGEALRLLTPTTGLTDTYNQALYCGLAGLAHVADSPPLPKPGLLVAASLVLGAERYRYPADLPKVAATGGPQCGDLPVVPPGTFPKFVEADTGADPWQYGNQGILLNSDGLKQMLFGPLDGPPRNSAQVGQPG